MRPVMQKRPRYENRKLLDLCHRAPCMLSFPVCTGGEDDERPSVPCHSNWQSDGRGAYYKTHDYATVPGCPSCHDALDKGPYSREQKEDTFRMAQRRFWAWLWESNKIKVA